MQTNPIRDINTDFKVTDVFKTNNANALTKSVPYDYVITEDMVIAARERKGVSPTAPIDVGEILWGGYQDLGMQPVYPDIDTCHIFINYTTTIDDYFDFGGWITVLCKKIHVYSLSSYATCGSSAEMFYHTQGEYNYVLLKSSTTLYRNSSIHVGSFMLDSPTGIGIWHPGAAVFEYERCISGSIPQGVSSSELVPVNQVFWSTNTQVKPVGSVATIVSLPPDSVGAPNQATPFYIRCSSGQLIKIPYAGYWPISSNGYWLNEFVKNTTIHQDGGVLSDYSGGILDVSTITELNVYTAAGVEVSNPSNCYIINQGVTQSIYAGSTFGNINPQVILDMDTMPINGKLVVNFNLVAFPWHRFVLKSDWQDNIVPTYTSGTSYSFGDIVRYNGLFYEAVTSTSQLPTSSDWIPVNIPLDAIHGPATALSPYYGGNVSASIVPLDTNSSIVPIYSWGYTNNNPIINQNSDTTYSPLWLSMSKATQVGAGKSPSNMGIISQARVCFCKNSNGQILLLGTTGSGYYG